MTNFIPKETYEQILEHAVISAVDAIIYNEGKVLLALRTQEPCKGQWWIPGGRQNKREYPEETTIRKIKTEIGLDVLVEKFIGCYDVIYDETAFPDVKSGVHYLARAYLVSLKYKNQDIMLDQSQKEYRWIDKIEENLDPYVRKVLEDSKVFDNSPKAL
jgi:colanic acid biosynthesis protein WcaH